MYVTYLYLHKFLLSGRVYIFVPVEDGFMHIQKLYQTHTNTQIYIPVVPSTSTASLDACNLSLSSQVSPFRQGFDFHPSRRWFHAHTQIISNTCTPTHTHIHTNIPVVPSTSTASLDACNPSPSDDVRTSMVYSSSGSRSSNKYDVTSLLTDAVMGLAWSASVGLNCRRYWLKIVCGVEGGDHHTRREE